MSTANRVAAVSLISAGACTPAVSSHIHGPVMWRAQILRILRILQEDEEGPVNSDVSRAGIGQEREDRLTRACGSRIGTMLRLARRSFWHLGFRGGWSPSHRTLIDLPRLSGSYHE